MTSKRTPKETAKSIISWTLKITGGFVLLVFALALVIPDPEPPVATALAPAVQQSAAMVESPAPAQRAPVEQKQVAPKLQADFLTALDNARIDLGRVANDMQKGAVRTQRKAALCKLIPSRSVSGWVGTIKKLDSTSDGQGILTVSLDSYTVLQTRNTSFADDMGGPATLIPANSELFAAVASMREGQRVRFSGLFLRDEDDCFKETSLSFEGGIEEPEFLFKFTSVEAL